MLEFIGLSAIFFVVIWVINEWACKVWRRGDPRRQEHYNKYGRDHLDDNWPSS